MPAKNLAFLVLAIFWFQKSYAQETHKVYFMRTTPSVKIVVTAPMTARMSLANTSVGATASNIFPNVDFGEVPVGLLASDYALLCGDGSSTSFAISNVVYSGSNDISLSTDTCSGRTFSGSACCSISLNFTPKSAGYASGSVSFTALDTFSGGATTTINQSFATSGTGVDFQVDSSDSDDTVSCRGSIVNLDNLSVSELIPITGTNFSLSHSTAWLHATDTTTLRKIGLGGWLPSNFYFYSKQIGKMLSGVGDLKTVTAKFDSVKNIYQVVNDDQVYVFNSDGFIIAIRDFNSGLVRSRFNYDTSGRFLSIVDQFNNATLFSYTAAGATIKSPFGQQTQVAFDGNGFLSSVNNPNNELYSVTTSINGYLITFKKPGGQTSQKTYDSSGLLTKELGAGGNYYSLTPTFVEANGLQTRTINFSNAIGIKRNTVINKGANSISRKENFPDGSSNALARTYGSSKSITDIYGGINSVTFIADPRFGNAAQYESTSRYQVPNSIIDLNQKTTRTATLAVATDPFSATSLVTKIMLQNDSTKTLTSTYTQADSSIVMKSPLARVVKRILNASGLITSEQVGNLIPTTYSYDARGLVVNKSQGASRVSTYTYDSFGRLSFETDFLNHKTSYLYDNANRVVQKTLPQGELIKMTYYKNGNLASLTPPFKPVHRWTYNLMELISSYLPPAVSSTVTGATAYSYNLGQQLTKITRPDASAISYAYNLGTGYLNSVTTTAGKYIYTYVPKTDLVLSLTAPSTVKSTYQYVGKLPLTETTSGPVSGKITYGYFADANVGSIAVTDKNNQSHSVNLAYDKDGLLISAGSLSLIKNSFAAVSASKLGTITESVGFDSFGQSSVDTYSTATAVLFKESLTRDSLGRIITALISGNDHSQNMSYVYDSDGRLVTVQKSGLTIRSYTYDSNGNRLSVTSGVATTNATYGNQDQLLTYGANTYTYNYNGERVSKKAGTLITTYTYDSFGNLLKTTLPNAQVIEYIYDGLQRRVGKKVNGILTQSFIYQSQTQIAAELDGLGNLVRRYVYGSKANTPDYFIQSGKEYRIISDHQGTPQLVMDSLTGASVRSLHFDEFGRSGVTSGTIKIPFGFAGGLQDSDTGLVHFGARDYDAETGRWMSKDPIGFDGGDTNLYGYVANDPVNFFDPDGLKKTFVYQGGNLSLYGDNGGQLFSGPAVSGPYGNGALPQGRYSVGGLRDNRSGSYSCSGSSGYSLDLNPQFSTNRTDLRIHPDGGVPGTLGCVGVSCGNGNADALGNILRGIYNQPMTPWIDLEVR